MEADGSGGVHIANFAFAPPTLAVSPGHKVTWTNADSIPHTSTSADKRWNSGPLAPGASFSVTFDKPGTYVYGCTIHPFMQAKVVVGN
jgi:plastocyanin